ncbi:MAG: cytochrome C552 [Flavobacteriaceae bacterium]|jgi:cytochrome c|nr:cytochrome C552 [Flavobacteriaceae bacterium]
MKFIKATFLVFATITMVACGKKEDKAAPEAVYESERGGETEMTQAEKVALGEKLFNGKGTCNACHIADKKIIGPSVQEIVATYDKYKGSIVTFLQGESEAIVDPSQFVVMQANFAITKKMTQTELEALEAYMRTM